MLELDFTDILNNARLPPVLVSEGDPNSRREILPFDLSQVTPTGLQDRVRGIAEVNSSVSLIGYAPLVLHPIVLLSLQAVVMPLALDPHFQRQALGMPLKARRLVRHLVRSGPEFDTFYIVHELTDEAFDLVIKRPDLLLARLDDIVGPPRPDPRAERIVAGTTVVARYGAASVVVGVILPAVLIAAVAAVAAAATAVATMVAVAPVVAVAAALTPTTVGLDPALIGVVTARGDLAVGEPAGFFHIVSWR
jgi:hypothetical protein